MVKVLTHSGHNIPVYFLNGEPMFFEMDKQVIPSGNYHTIQCNCTTLKSRTVKSIVPSSEARILTSCYECNFSNCVEMSEKLRTSAGFELKPS